MRLARAPRWLVPLLLLLPALASAGGVTPELQQRVRGATFEVVLKKPEPDPLSYEKPLPLELLPYIERTDAYRSIGTAFAVGHNTYITAGHVLVAGVSSQYGAPQLRGADGRVHAIARILKFSAHEDFAVFSLADDPDPTPLLLNREPHIDDAVLAVGNALGEGIIIRDGLFTSETAEDQDGRWKWIRFSAAASPGNSGGPLLDAAGRVIGIVIGKSQNENLNYSLPIGRALDAAGVAAFDLRSLQSLPFLRGTRTYSIQDSFALPKAWSEFGTAYGQLIERHGDRARAALLTAFAAKTFPQGPGVEALLYDFDAAYFPRLIAQDDDDSWSADALRFTRTDLGGDGYVSVAATHGVSLLRLHRPGNAADGAWYADSKAFMDLALKGLGITRPVGSDEVRVTSLGPALDDVRCVDHYGRRWQQRAWRLPYLDAYVVALLLPTPDGYVGLLQYTPSLALPEARKRIELLADLFYVSYWGSMQQWRAYLSRHDWLPEALTPLKLEANTKGDGWRLVTPRLNVDLGAAVMPTNERSMLGLQMAYMPDAGRVIWSVGAIAWYQDESEKSFVMLGRQQRPPASAERTLRERWDDLVGRRSPFSGTPTRDGANSWTVQTVIDVPGRRPDTVADDVTYSLTVHTENRQQYEDVVNMTRQTLLAVRIVEHGASEHAAAPAAAAAPGGGAVTAEFDRQLVALETYVVGLRDYGARLGRDLRGREFADDLRDYWTNPAEQAQVRQLRDALARAESAGQTEAMAEVGLDLKRAVQQRLGRMQMLMKYWSSVPQLRASHEQWGAFLARNHLPADIAHSEQVLGLEKQIGNALAASAPDVDVEILVEQLESAYADERKALYGRIRTALPRGGPQFQERATACPTPVTDGTGGTHSARVDARRGIDEYYPAQSRRDGETGSVVLAIRVDAGGCALGVAVVVSSGFERLDAAALRWIQEASTFVPASAHGKPVESVKDLSVTFRLKEYDADGLPQRPGGVNGP